MIFDDLKRVYALVGEITTEFNNLEQLWYLIFTCLLYRAPRSAIDAVFEQHKTGGGQRKMIVDVALARKAEVERIGGPNDKAILIPVFDAISNLSKVTNELAGRRNHVMHSL